MVIVIVFRTIPYGIGLVVIPIVLLPADRPPLKMMDYPLLMTFVFFFIFSGNMACIDMIRNFFSMLPDKSTLHFSVFSCQFISNFEKSSVLAQNSSFITSIENNTLHPHLFYSQLLEQLKKKLNVV